MRASYELLHTELAEMGHEKSASGGTTNADGNNASPPEVLVCDGLLRHLSIHLLLFIKGRLQMITLYPFCKSSG